MDNNRFRCRAWNKEKNIMHYEAEKGIPDIIPFAYMCKSDEFVIEQCTGLKDKNGRLIYEGDIVDILCEVDELGVIEWAQEEAKFAVRAPFAGFVADFDNYRGTDLEVISNIHENPELLESKNA